MKELTEDKSATYITLMKIAVAMTLAPVLGFIGKFAGMFWAAQIRASGGEGLEAFSAPAMLSQWSIAVTFVIGLIGLLVFIALLYMHARAVKKRNGADGEHSAQP